VPGFLAEQMPPEFKKLSPLAKLDALYAANLIEISEGNEWPVPVRFLEADDGQPLQDLWAYQPYTEGTVYGIKAGIDADVMWLGPKHPERLGYQTQKPTGLLGRIIESSCPESGNVLDPFCGCGTTIHTAQKLKREWIGIDITNLAIGLIEDRLRRAFPGVKFEVHGTPKDMDGARALAAKDKYQFQWWATRLIPGGVPYGGKKKGADAGIDGLFYPKVDPKTTEKGIISVKGGENINVAMVRDLAHVVKREKAQMGIFITLVEPTKPMLTEAVKEGLYETPFGKFPRLQVATVQDLLEGKIPRLPPTDDSSFRRATKEIIEQQDALPF
jgi:hypothetical protein